MNYLDHLGRCDSTKALCRHSVDFIRKNFRNYHFNVYSHSLSEQPILLIDEAGLKNGHHVFGEWTVSDQNLPDCKSIHFVKNDYVYFTIGRTEQSFDFYIIVFEQLISAGLLAIIRYWHRLDSVIRQTTCKNHVDECEKNGELVSQLLHDTESIISLINTKSQSADLTKRIAYQHKTSENVLFYIRDVDLITAAVPVKELLTSSLELISADWKKIKVNISSELADIVIDSEFFAIALKNIIGNSLIATGGCLEKISINVTKTASESPFIPFDWVRFEIIDSGTGIHEDYMPFITNPFFTTRKQQGAAGFGLTNTRKIVNAHNGFINFDSNPEIGTTINIFLPEKF